jgi:transposase
MTPQAPGISFGVRAPPQPKQRKLDVLAREAHKQAYDEQRQRMEKGLQDIEKLIASKRAVFGAGQNGLQAYRARAIQSCLHMVVKNGQGLIEASECAAKSQGFAPSWSGRTVRQWVARWLKSCELPTSQRGRHQKVFSLLDDPNVCTELHSYLWTNKWSMNPQKLADFTKNKLLPDESKKYLRHVVSKEMPAGLKKYMELELFPHIQLKVARGISLRMVRRWLHKEGFKYTAHKKALYYDGHKREDVVDYQQNVFLPAMKKFESRLVGYMVGNVEKEIELQLAPGERKVVLVAHDEMTAQANDGATMSWVWQGEQPLKKKGVGRGLHQSDVICSTKGWLSEASQTLEYGKNYDGYWNGELFVKQVWLDAMNMCRILLINFEASRENYSRLRAGAWA